MRSRMVARSTILLYFVLCTVYCLLFTVYCYGWLPMVGWENGRLICNYHR